jgi:GT2 family glycosyltransferase
MTVEEPVSVLAPAGLASVLIPCVGQLEFTRLCLPSVLQHTRMPYELIFIDIGSLDGTAEYLAGLAAAARVRVEVVRTPTDLGLKQAVFDALGRARGEYLVLLNNDTVVPHAWLNHLTKLASMSNTIGLVGPMSNYAAAPQLVQTVPYRVGPRRSPRGQDSDSDTEELVDTGAIHAFAQEFGQQHRGQWAEVERLGGFCLLLKRAVLKKIEQTSALRDWTDLGLFDTDILSVKARQAGFTLACARDVFVHHFGSRIFAHGGPNADSTSK